MDDIVLELLSEVRRIYNEKHTCTFTFSAICLMYDIALIESICPL